VLSQTAAPIVPCSIVLSDLRLSQRVDVADLLGSIFVINSDRLSRYWADPGGFDRFVAAEQEIASLVLGLRDRGWEAALSPRISRGGVFKEFSDVAREVWFRARELAKRGPPDRPRTMSLVFPEHLLLSIAERAELRIVQRLLSSGLRVDSLRQDVEHGIE